MMFIPLLLCAHTLLTIFIASNSVENFSASFVPIKPNPTVKQNLVSCCFGDLIILIITHDSISILLEE